MSTINNKITIAELSRLLGISRPTLYKYINCYDDDNYELIPEIFLDILKYIDNNEIYSKEQIYNYCMSKFMAKSNKGIMDRVKVMYDSNKDFSVLLDYLINNSNLNYDEILKNIERK